MNDAQQYTSPRSYTVIALVVGGVIPGAALALVVPAALIPGQAELITPFQVVGVSVAALSLVAIPLAFRRPAPPDPLD
jgi:hypothetical protein